MTLEPGTSIKSFSIENINIEDTGSMKTRVVIYDGENQVFEKMKDTPDKVFKLSAVISNPSYKYLGSSQNSINICVNSEGARLARVYLNGKEIGSKVFDTADYDQEYKFTYTLTDSDNPPYILKATVYDTPEFMPYASKVAISKTVEILPYTNSQPANGGKPKNQETVGEPVNIITGNYYASDIDLYIDDRGIDIEIMRYYNSLDEGTGLLGKSWRLGYETNVSENTETGEIFVEYPDGKVIMFGTLEGVNKCISPKGVFDELHKNNDGTYTLKLKGKVTYEYNQRGKLSSITDRNNNSITFGYVDGELASITGAGGKSISVEVEDGKITSLSDSSGRIVTYSYNFEGNLQKVTGTGGGTEKYEYDKNGLLKSITDENGIKFIDNYYDEKGRVALQYDSKGNRTIYSYDDENRENTYTLEAAGSSVKYKYDKDMYIVRKTFDDGSYEEYTYDELGNRTSIKDRNGNITKYGYDGKGNIISVTAPEPFSYKTNYWYDENNNITEIMTEGGSWSGFEYDANGNVTKSFKKVDEDTFVSRTYGYDSYGRVTSMTDERDNSTWFEYGEGDKPVRVIDPEGNTTMFGYDELGRRTSVTNDYGTISFVYNNQDKVEKVIDASGNITSYEYDKRGKLVKSIKSEEYESSNGKGTTYVYDGEDRLIRMINPLGTINAVKYDGAGNKIKEINPNFYDAFLDDGEGVCYEYDKDQRLIRVVNPSGEKSRIKYDPLGNIVKIIDANNYDEAKDDGPGVVYSYDELSRLTKVRDPYGNVVKRFLYDDDGKVIKQIDSKGYLSAETDKERYGTVYRYNLAGWLLEERKPVTVEGSSISHEVRRYEYDRAGNVIKEKFTPEYVSLNGEPSSWNEISYVYDKVGNIVKVTDSEGAYMDYTYDSVGNLTLKREKISDEKFKVTGFEYDKSGRIIKIWEEIDNDDLGIETSGVTRAETKYQYDRNGNIISVTSSEGYQTTFRYDAVGRLIEKSEEVIEDTLDITSQEELDVTSSVYGSVYEAGIITIPDIDIMGKGYRNGKIKTKKGNDTDNSETLTYETYNHNVIRKTAYRYDKAGNLIEETDTNGNKSNYRYDSINRLIAVTDKEGATSRIFYDEVGNRVRAIIPENYDPASDNGVGTTFRYDLMNRLIEVLNEKGNLIGKNEYDNYGQLIKSIDGVGSFIEYTYDLGGRLITQTTAESKSRGLTSESYVYNALGQVISVIDGEGNRTSFERDMWGRATEIMKANGVAEYYSYDHMGNVVSSKDGNGYTTHYTYNSMNRISSIIDPEGNSSTYLYDKMGRVVKEVDRNGSAENYSYNRDNNLTLIEASGEIQRYLYNKDGSISAAINEYGIDQYEYTANGYLSRKYRNSEEVLSYQYDRNGSITGVTDKSGMSTGYTYDEMGRLESVLDGSRIVAAYRYNVDNTVEKVDYMNGVSITYAYDRDKNITSLVNKDSKGHVIGSYSYSYDNNGNQISKTENKKVTYYAYDEINRLIREGNITYTYDNADNRTSMTEGKMRTDYYYDSRNRLLKSDSKKDKETLYTYDNDGNMLTRTTKAGTTHYSYDGFDRLNEVTNPDGTWMKNIYDGEGLRASVIENGSVSNFVFDRGSVVAEFGHNDELISRSLRGLTLVANKDHKGDTDYYLHNGHRDVVSIVDNRGKELNRYEYDAFGNTAKDKEKVHNRFKHAGEQFDAISGLYYLRARYYDSTIGRFTQEDTYRGDGLNLYTYVRNNPIKYIDPSGHSSKDVTQGTESGFYSSGSYVYNSEGQRMIAIGVGSQYPYAPAHSSMLDAIRNGQLKAMPEDEFNNMMAELNSGNQFQDKGNGWAFKGAGIQVELSLAEITVGVEVIWYTGIDMIEDEYDYGFLNPYFYIYSGVSISGMELKIFTMLKEMLTNVKDIPQLFKLQGSASIVGIIGNKSFTTPESYEGRFNTVSGSINHYKIGGATTPDYSTWAVSIGYGTQAFGFSAGSTFYTLANGIENRGKSLAELFGKNVMDNLTNIGEAAMERAREEVDKKINN